MRPRLRFLDFSKSWAFGKIIDLASICYGKSQSEVESNSGNYPIFGSGGIIGKANIFLYNKPSVLIGRKGTIDKPFYIETPFWTVDTMFYTRINEYTNANFIFYLFNTIKWKKYSEQSGVPSLSGSTIENINVFYPEKPEQDKIATFLNLYYKKIELQKQKIEQLERLSFDVLFSNKYQGRLVRLGDILTEAVEKTILNNQYEVVSSAKAGLYYQKDYFNREIASENNIGYKILRQNQIVISPQNLWLGNINYNNKIRTGIVSPSYKIFDIDSKFNKIFIAHLLKTKKAIYEYGISSEQGASIVRRNLNIELFYEITFKIPERDIQDKIALQIELLSDKITKEKQKLELMEKYKQGLLQQMFI